MLTHCKIIYVDPRAEANQLQHGSADSAGFDLSIYPKDEDGNPLDEVTIGCQETVLINTGVRVWLGAEQRACFGMIVPRSSVGHKLNVMLGNSVGIIDSDYQGEIRLSLHNRSATHPLTVRAGDRMAQMIVVPFLRSMFHAVESFDAITERGEGGYGSTGR